MEFFNNSNMEMESMEPPSTPSQRQFDTDIFDEERLPDTFIDTVEDEEKEFEMVLKDTLRYVAGFKKGRKSTKFSPESQQLMGEANVLFANKSYDEAILKIKACIQLSPNSQQPWKLLSLIYQELGNQVKAMQTDFVAAHFDLKNTELWLMLADYAKRGNKIKESIYCMTKAIQSKPTTELYYYRSTLFLEANMPLKCAKDYLEIVKLNKHSVSLMMEAVNVFLGHSRYDLVFQILLPIFEGFRLLITQKCSISNFPSDRPFLPVNFVHVDLLFEALIDQQLYAEAIYLSKSAILVLYYHSQEEYMPIPSLLNESLSDVDPTDELFNSQILTLAPTLDNPNLIANGLPVTWRIYLGVCRCYTNQLEVAKTHLNFLFEHFISNNDSLYENILSVLLENKYYECCIAYLTPLLDEIDTDFKFTCYYHLAVSFEQLQDFSKAMDYYTLIIQHEGPYCNQSRINIAQLQTALNQNPIDAWRDVRTIIPSTLKINLTSASVNNNKVDFKEVPEFLRLIKSKCKVFIETLNQTEKNTIPYQSLAAECAEAYAIWFDLFLKSNTFFCKEKNKKFVGEINNKPQYETIDTLEINTDDFDLNCIYLETTFKEWIDMMLQLIKCLLINKDYLQVIDICKKAVPSNLFTNLNRKTKLLLIQYSCYCQLNDFDNAMDAIRQVMVLYPYYENSYHFFMQLLPHNQVGSKAISNNNMSRCFKRHLSKFNSHLMSNNSKNCYYSLLLNAYSLLSSRSVQPSLSYLMRCVQLHENDPLTHLMVGMGWFTRAMNRSTEDRHFNIITGVYYLKKYYELEQQRHYKQANYNMGRAFQQIGLTTTSLDFYLKCICPSNQQSIQTVITMRPTRNELDLLAIYNCHLLLKNSRNIQLANQVLMHWITI